MLDKLFGKNKRTKPASDKTMQASDEDAAHKNTKVNPAEIEASLETADANGRIITLPPRVAGDVAETEEKIRNMIQEAIENTVRTGADAWWQVFEKEFAKKTFGLALAED